MTTSSKPHEGTVHPEGSCAKVVVSAPGKVLLTGGYLVLDKSYTGLVVSVPYARFYAATSFSSGSGPAGQVRVHSPQFPKDPPLLYPIEEDINGQAQLGDETQGRKNPFVESGLQWAIRISSPNSLVHKGRPSTLDIHILGDNAFYSPRHHLTVTGLSPSFTSVTTSLSPFLTHTTRLSDTPKTGLGSSAALTTSLVGALLVLAKEVSDELTESEKWLIHHVSQIAHCDAQGKVGSGFDVSAAIWGSHIYRRFSPEMIKGKLDTREVSSGCWDGKAQPFSLPRGFTLYLADISTGSHTPSMVSKVNTWRKEHPREVSDLWSRLAKGNQSLESIFQALGPKDNASKDEKDKYDHQLEQLSHIPVDQWEGKEGLMGSLSKLHSTFQEVRLCLREMGEASGAPIEPPSQTKLLNACQAIPGVIFAGAPGAGGYDAIFCLGIGKNVARRLEELWSSWTDGQITPLTMIPSSENDEGSELGDPGIRCTYVDQVTGLHDILNRGMDE
ncbi:MAG: Phosphomevalonate kinase [Piptocephalis tieghemiana]|nr:MAG: Phosphomevalonate kinase [Piptocephalis tieghemiana]